MSDNTLYFEDVQLGQELPTFQRTTDLMNWNRFAAVNDEFVYVHMDDDYAKARGDKGVFGMGNLRLSYLHNLLRNWVGDSGIIKKLSCQYRGLNYKGDTLVCKGKVTRKYHDGKYHLVDLELWVENQNGENITPGRASVALPSRKDSRPKKGGEIF